MASSVIAQFIQPLHGFFSHCSWQLARWEGLWHTLPKCGMMELEH